MRKLTLALPCLLALAAGCAPPWQVVRQAAPNPFLGKPSFVVEPLRFDRLQVGGKTEEMWMAAKTPEQQQSWAGDKAGMNEEFDRRMVEEGQGLQFAVAPAPQPPGAWIVRSFVPFYEPGFFTGTSIRRDTIVDIVVQLLDPSGQTVLDEFNVRAYVQANLFNPATGGRARSATKHLGAIVARYLRSRVLPGS